MYTLIKCSICKCTIENVNEDELVEKYKWKGTIKNMGNNKIIDYWYCPKHSIREQTNFEGEEQ